MKKRSKKKGLTLMEVLISLAIMSILIVPTSNLIISSVKMNKDSEDKQKAVTIAQQLVEEIKALQKSDLADKKILSNGLQLNKDTDISNPNGFIGTKANIDGDFQADIKIKPKENLEVNNGGENRLSYDLELTIDGEDDNLNLGIKGDPTSYNIKKDNLKIQNSDLALKVGRKSVDASRNEVFEELKTISFSEAGNRRVSVKFGQNTNLTNEFILNTLNSSLNYVSVYFELDDATKLSAYSLNNEGGVIRKYTNIKAASTNTDVTRAYEINIAISKNGKKLYEAKAYKAML